MAKVNKDNINESKVDEIDVVDLIGVLIKRRAFIIWFIVIATGVCSSFFVAREFKRSFGPERIFASEVAASSSRDSIFTSYSFIKRKFDAEGYKSFLNVLLFPADATPPSFEVQFAPNGGVDYFFNDAQSLVEFSKRYKSFSDNIKKMADTRATMDEDVYASCRQLYLTRSMNIQIKDLFPGEQDLKACNLFNYYFGIVQGKLLNTLVGTSTTVGEPYLNFIVDYASSNKEGIALIEGGAQKDSKTTFKFKYHFNKGKVVKYTLLAFILSTMLAAISVYVIEFFKNNRTRIAKYWKK